MIGDAAQYRELVELYGTYGDDELIALGRGMADLTEMAQEALKSEIARRGLSVGSAADPQEAHGLSDEDLANLRAYAKLAAPECVFEFEDEAGASAAYHLLAEEGIEAVVLAVEGSSLEQRGPRVVVGPDDAERAEAILSQPLTQRFRKEAEDEVPAEFDLPACPECGGEETLLESVDPVNHWHCDECGHSWVEGGCNRVQ